MTERDNGQPEAVVDDRAIVFRQCPFRTGAWQCRLWRQARQRDAMCDMHQRSLREGVRDMPGMLRVLLEEREIARGARAIEDLLSDDDLKIYRQAKWDDGCSHEEALARVADYPFHWRPIAECWHLLTGQPLPPSYSPTTTKDARHATPQP